MRKAFLYRIYPTKAHATKLAHALEECRWTYNQLVEQRKLYWEEFGLSVGLYDQQAYLPYLKRERPTLSDVHSLVVQNVNVRVDLAFQAFFRRVKAGGNPGYPRFRGPGRYDSLTYSQYGNGAKLSGSQLQLSKIGNVKIVLHRPLEGTPKTVTIRHSATGKWYAAISCEWAPTPLPPSPEHIGIDVGLAAFATFSDGAQIDNPRFFRTEEKALARAQRRQAKLEQGSPARRKHRKVVARVHERITFRRANFAHQHSRKIVNRYQVIAVEDLTVEQMVHNHCLAKSILDAAWTQFTAFVAYKAAWAGRHYIAVNPAYTSQDCHNCGHRQKMPLAERVYLCSCCGWSGNRDHNAARNILARGLARIGSQSIEAPAFTPGE